MANPTGAFDWAQVLQILQTVIKFFENQKTATAGECCANDFCV